MGFLQRLFGDQQISPQSTSGGLFRVGLRSTFSAQWDYERIVTSVYANPYGRMAVDYIANNICRPAWEVRQPGADDALETHPLLDLLNNPMPGLSGTELQRQIATELQLAGKSFWLKLDNQQLQGALQKTVGAHRWAKDAQQRQGPTVALQRLNPGRTSVLCDEDERIIGFIYSDLTGQRVAFYPEQICYLRYPHPSRSYDGLAPAMSAGLASETDAAAARFNYDLLTNDSALPGYLVVDGLTVQQFAEFKQQWEASAYTGKTRFLGSSDAGSASYVKVGQTNQELTYDKLREASQKDVSVAFGLAYVLLNPTDSTFSNMEVAKALSWHSKIHPTCVLIADQLTAQLGAEFGVNVGFDFDQIEELQESMDAAVNRAHILLDDDVITINEVRGDLGLDPVPWGDYSLSYLRQLTAPPVAGLPDPVPAPVDEGLGAGVAEPDNEDIDKLIGDAERIVKTLPPTDTKASRRSDWEQFNRRTRGFEKRAQRKMTRFFNTQGEVIVARLRGRSTRSYEKALHDSTWWDQDRWNRDLRAVSEEFLADTVDAFGTGSSGEFDMAAQSVVDYLSNRSQDIAGLVNTTTADDLRSLIAEQTNQGASIDTIADSISGYFTDRAEWRSELVARTEVIGAANFATLESARQSGVATGKTFLASPDCEEECASYDGSSFGLDDDSVDIPVHPNCRCTWLIETENGDLVDDGGEDG